MPLFSEIDHTDFLDRYWQRSTCVMRQSFPNLIDVISADELAGLSLEEEIESRIISGFEIDDDWTCQHGPFIEADFTEQNNRQWTLLVQSVDQWDDSIRAILNQFNFLPRWRLEDIMISYAPTGGGVGPHFDYYDVFLIQVSGTREWLIGQSCSDDSEIQDNAEVKLLAQFEQSDAHQLVAGDAIYIPAGIAHWGTALTDNCITLSVGFRAPSDREILAQTFANLIESLSDPANSASAFADSKRYRDTSQSIDSQTHKINSHALMSLSGILDNLSPLAVKEALHRAFGQLVTESKFENDSSDNKHWSLEQLTSHLDKKSIIRFKRSHTCRFAYSDTELFVNGEAFFSDEAFSQLLCEGTTISSPSEYHLKLIIELANRGHLEILDCSD